MIKNKTLKPSYQIIDHLYDERKDFIILGLCGRVGSGVSTVSSILEKDFSELQLPKPGFSESNLYDAHEYRILYTYAEKNWKTFYKIRTSALITRRTLTCIPEEFVEFLLQIYENDISVGIIKEKIEGFVKDFFDKKMLFNLESYCERLGLDVPSTISAAAIYLDWDLNVEELKEKITLDSKSYYDKLQEEISSDNDQKIKIEYNDGKLNITATNKALSDLLDNYSKLRREKSGYKNPLCYCMLQQYVYEFLPNEASEFWRNIGKISKSLPTHALQLLGNNLRLNKMPYYKDSGVHMMDDGYVCLAEDINLAIKILRAYQLKIQDNHKFDSDGTRVYEPRTRKTNDRTMVVIDSIKNPYESLYLKSRYSNYYLIGIYTDDIERKARLRYHQHLTDDDIYAIDIIEQNGKLKENIEKLIKLYNSKQNESEQSEREKIPKIINKIFEDFKKKGLDTDISYIAPFVFQNVSSCLDSADILINNKSDNNAYLNIKYILLKYVSLIMNPGIILPTPIERCMQIAHTAKLNSGCISRQVGAVITDSEYHLLSIGWNQQPEGQIPCSYRDLCELFHHWSTEAYSDYENDDNRGFQVAIKNQVKYFFDTTDSPLMNKGKLPHYCFKDYHNSIEHKNNQVHTRALHAEETAFLSLGVNNTKAKGGVLFTTSSPCELCAKKAMHLGIATIYYIESYAGVSKEHVMNIGESNCRPNLILFTGAIGTSYTKLYTPLLPIKDENEMWMGEKMTAEFMK